MDPRRARSFGAVADAYARARPTYPREALQFVVPPGAGRVVDLGAGTGKVTTGLLDLGLEVVAVEPDDAMRAHVDSRAEALAGTAEQVPLPDASVDAVVAGQAWHWFDTGPALAEVRRVLRPGGTLGLLWNVLDDSEGWALDVAEILGLEDRLSLIDREATSPATGREAWGPWSRQLFAHTQEADAELVVANMASRSVVIVQEPEQRSALLARVRAALPDGRFEVPWICDAWRATAP
ncbi:MAG: class I SAM-dependent methyltransferase [Actinomycetes bacterium]